MTDALNETSEVPPAAGFWIRLLAQFIDACVWAFSVSWLGWALVFLAPDTFGMARAFPETILCTQLDSIPRGFQIPAGLSPKVVARCTKSFFGAEFRNELILAEQRREGNMTTTKRAVYVVDRDLVPKQVFDLDWIFWLAFLGYLVLAQGIDGATLGKRLLRLRVIGSIGGSPGWRAALVRNLVLLSPILAVIAVVLPIAFLNAFFSNVWWLAPLGGLGGLAMLMLAGQIWWTASHGRPSIHDRVPGTRMIRLPRPDPLAMPKAAP